MRVRQVLVVPRFRATGVDDWESEAEGYLSLLGGSGVSPHHITNKPRIKLTAVHGT